MSRPLRIAHVAPVATSVPPAGSGSIEALTSHLTEGLVARGHDVTLFATGDSTTGAAMLAHGRPAAAREWLADWQSRQNLDPWMLSHVALALRWSGHDAEARAASEQALAKGSPTIDHPLWVAFDHALAGAHDEAHTALAPISQTPTTDAYDRWLLAATKALTAALSPTLTPTQRRAAIAGYLDEARTCGATRRQWKVLRRLHTRVKRHIAALA